MARLPDVFEREIPQGERSVIQMRPNTYAGVSNIARNLEGVNQLQEHQRQAQAEFDSATAESELLSSHISTLDSLTGDNYAEFVPSYQKEMKKALDNSSQLITDPAARARFIQRANVMMIRGTQQAHEKSIAKEGDLGRASLVTTLDKNRTGAMSAGDEATRVAFIGATQQAIKGARDKGWLDAEQAATLSQKAAEDYAVSAFELLPPEARIAALTGKKAAWDLTSQYNTKLTPTEETQYQAWLKTLPEKQRNAYDYDMRGAFKAGVQPSVNGHFPDTYKKPNHPTFSNESQYASPMHPGGSWNGESYTPAPTSLDFIPPDKRAILLERAQTEIVQMQNAQEKARKDAIERGMVEASNAIEQGGIHAVDPNLWSNLQPEQRKSLRSYAEQISKGVQPENDWGTIYGLRGLPDTEFVNRNLMDYRDKMDDAHFDEMTKHQAQLRAGDEKAAQQAGTYRSEESIFNSTMYTLGINPLDAKTDTDKADKLFRFQHAFDESLYQERVRLGRKSLSPNEMQKVMDDLVISVHVPGTPFLGMEFGEKDYRIDDIPIVEADKIRAVLAKRGQPADNAAVVNAWAKIQQAAP